MDSLFSSEFSEVRKEAPARLRTAWLLEGILLSIGFVCFFWVAATYGRTWFYQSFESYQLEQTVHGSSATVLGWLKYAALGQTPEMPVAAGRVPAETRPADTRVISSE